MHLETAMWFEGAEDTSWFDHGMIQLMYRHEKYMHMGICLI